MTTQRKYNLTAVLVFFIGLAIVSQLVWPLVLIAFIPIWAVASLFVATAIAERTFDRWDDDLPRHRT